MTHITNDNEQGAAKRPQDPDAHGQAALLLAESLIHGLVAASTLTVEQAIEIVDIACEVKVEVAEIAGEARTTLAASLDLLSGIRTSLASEGLG